MVELLVQVQNESVGRIPDLFVALDAPFENAAVYGHALTSSLVEQYEASRDGLDAEGIVAEWKPPAIETGESGARWFVRTCTSLRHYYQREMLALAVYLSPGRVGNPQEWVAFLRGLLACDIPETVRITVVDDCDVPLLEELAASEKALVMSVTPELDMAGALEEIVETAPGVGSGNEFRKLFVRLSNLAKKGDVQGATKTAVQALLIAKKEKWYHLQVAVYMVLGGMYLGKQDAEMSLKSYSNASRAAGRNASFAAATRSKDKHPAPRELLVQTGFAEGSALVAMEEYPRAATHYEQLAPAARHLADGVFEVEAWRMAAYCYEMALAPAAAWRCGEQALDAGMRMKEGMRPTSTLPFAGQRMLALIRQGKAPRKADERQLRQRMDALVGPGWES